MPEEFRARVLEVVGRLGAGEVASYGDVAAEAGYPGAARGVGAVLAHCEDDLPWWRVVTANGRLVPGHEAEHARRLEAEGVAVRAGRVAGMSKAALPRSGSPPSRMAPEPGRPRGADRSHGPPLSGGAASHRPSSRPDGVPS